MKAQIATYIVLGLVLFLVFLGVLNLIVDIVPRNKVISASDVNVFANSCLESSLECALYTRGLGIKQQTMDETKLWLEDYIKNSLNLCLGNLSQKFRGNKFKFETFAPQIIFADESTVVELPRLGDMNTGNARKTLENYALKTQIAFSKIFDVIQKLPKDGNEKRVESSGKRFKLDIYQLDSTKEAVIVTDAGSKINGKDFKALFVD